MRHYYAVFLHATNSSRMSPSFFFNNWWGWQNSLCKQCMASYKHLWNLWNGNTWPLYVNIGQAKMHGRRPPTPCNFSRGGSTGCLAQSLPSVLQTFVEFISPQQIDWFWWFMLHLKARSLQGAILYPLRHMADVEAKVRFRSRPRQCYSPLSRFMRRI